MKQIADFEPTTWAAGVTTWTALDSSSTAAWEFMELVED